MPSLDSNDERSEELDIAHFHGRAQALADGQLVDISAMARGVGFIVPVAITWEAWVECVECNEPLAHAEYRMQNSAQAEHFVRSGIGRLWGLLRAARSEALRRPAKARVRFALRVPRHGGGGPARRVVLSLQTHCGDQGEPVVTIMLPWQD